MLQIDVPPLLPVVSFAPDQEFLNVPEIFCPISGSREERTKGEAVIIIFPRATAAMPRLRCEGSGRPVVQANPCHFRFLIFRRPNPNRRPAGS